VLKKSNWDCKDQVRSSLLVLKDVIDSNLTTAFSRFTSQVLDKDPSDQSLCVVRAEYLHLNPRVVAMTVLSKLCHLYSTVVDQQMSWEQSEKKVKAAKIAALRVNDVIAQFMRCMDEDKLLQKLFQVQH